jgi:hypothetical protein
MKHEVERQGIGSMDWAIRPRDPRIIIGFREFAWAK